MKKGDRIKLLGLPTGSNLPRKLKGREGVITYVNKVNGFGEVLRFYSVTLDPLPRERVEKVVGDLPENKLELLR